MSNPNELPKATGLDTLPSMNGGTHARPIRKTDPNVEQTVELDCGCATFKNSFVQSCAVALALWTAFDNALLGKSRNLLQACYVALRRHGKLPVEMKVEDWRTFG